MTPIKEPCRVSTLSRLALSFLAKLAHPKAHATGPPMRSRIRLAFFPPGPLPCALSC